VLRGVSPGHRYGSYGQRLKGGLRDSLTIFGVQGLKESGRLVTEFARSRNATSTFWAHSVVMGGDNLGKYSRGANQRSSLIKNWLSRGLKRLIPRNPDTQTRDMPFA